MLFRSKADELIRDAHKLASASLIAKHMTEGSQNMMFLSLHGLLFRAGWSEEQVLKFARLVYIARWGTQAELGQCKSEVEDSAKRFQKEENQYGYPTLIELIPQAVVNSALNWLNVQYNPSDSHTDSEAVHQTDFGNALLFVRDHKEIIRYCSKHKEFYSYEDGYWQQGDTKPANCFIQTIKKAQQAALSLPSGTDEQASKRKEHLKYYIACENTKRLQDGLKAVKYMTQIQIDPLQFDCDPYLLNVANGTIDLRTGHLKAHDPSDMLTKKIMVEYDPSASSELWIQFINQVFENNSEYIDYVQKAVGATIIGSSNIEKFFILIGEGGTGKGTFLSTIASLLGKAQNYAVTVPINTFTCLRKETGKADNTLYDLRDKRLVIAHEPDSVLRLNEGFIKTVTGGDDVRTRPNYERDIEYQPQFTVWLSCNKDFEFDGSSTGMQRRVCRLKFRHKPTKPDIQLKEKLRTPESLSGIMAWAVQGAVKFLAEGLNEPTFITEWNEELMRQNNPIQQFLEESFIFDDSPTTPKSKFITLKEFVIRLNEYQAAFNGKEFNKREVLATLESMKIQLIDHRNKKILKGYILRTPDNDDKAAYYDFQKVDSKSGNIFNA